MAGLPCITYHVTPDERHPARVHVWRSGNEHDVDSVRCWCRPQILAVCECDDGCWKCGGHGSPAQLLTPEEAEAPDAPACLVVHRG